MLSGVEPRVVNAFEKFQTGRIARALKAAEGCAHSKMLSRVIYTLSALNAINAFNAFNAINALNAISELQYSVDS